MKTPNANELPKCLGTGFVVVVVVVVAVAVAVVCCLLFVVSC